MQRISSSTIPTATAFLVVGFVLSACVQPPPMVIQNASGDIVPLKSWSASLATVGNGESSGLRGEVILMPGASIRETRAVLTVAGGTPHDVHPWYVQLGDCGNDRGILAGLMAYPPVTVDESGEAQASVTLPFTLPTSGRYFVSVRQSETDVTTVIACGNLTRASDRGPQQAGYAKAVP